MTTGVPAYSTTPANNVNANTGVNWDEGMNPGAVNNSARANMADLRGFANDLIWFQYGSGTSPVVTPAYASGTSFTVAGVDVTAVYHAGRRVKAVGSGTGTIYGSISSSSFSTNTTVNVTWDSGSLTSEALTISISQIPRTGNPVAPNPTRQVLTSGSGATYTTPGGVHQLRIRMVGGGGGSAGTATVSGATSGGTGGTTTFNSITAIGGGGSAAANPGANVSGGSGGTGGSGAAFRAPGNAGQTGQASSGNGAFGGGGGGSLLGGGARGGSGATAAAANSGGGGSGPNQGNTAGTLASGGGGGGEYVEFTINSPSATYTYTVGTTGAAGTGDTAGAAGGTGVIIVDEIY